MKKNKDGKKERSSRRLTLHRETIQILDDPALLELARGEYGVEIARTSMSGTVTGYEQGGC